MGSKTLYCNSCHWHGKRGKSKPRGSTIVELVVWIIFFMAAYTAGWLLLLPAIIYSLWRRRSKRMVCPTCGNKLIPAAAATDQYMRDNYDPDWDDDSSDDYSSGSDSGDSGDSGGSDD